MVLVETRPLQIPVLTDQLYVYHWPPELAGRGDRPIGLLALFVLGCAAVRRVRHGQRALEGGPLLLPFAIFLACVAWGAVHGLTSGGILKIVVLEVRPFWYLFIAYLLAYNLVARAWHVRALGWALVVGAGVKALQGLYVYLWVLHGHLEGHHAILAHEDSYFLAAVIVLGALFFLQRQRHAQYHAILQLLPLIAVTMIANQRRAAEVALLAGLGVAWALVFAAARRERGRLLKILRVAVPIVVGGVLLLYQTPGLLGRPAHAIISLIRPDPADTIAQNSNRYRAIENHDLWVTAMQHPLLGLGFGLPFGQDIALPDISVKYRYYDHIPHNTILWVLMRLGLVGFLALWYLLGSIVVRGSRVATRLSDPYAQAIAMLAVTATVMEIPVAYADLQLAGYRNVLYLGLLAGTLMRLPACDRDAPPRA